MKLKFYHRVLIILSLLLVAFYMWKFNPGCLIQKNFGIPCPSCGMTRALFALINGDFKLSLELHPMLLSIPILFVMFLFYEKLFSGRLKVISITVLVLILSGFLINYLLMF